MPDQNEAPYLDALVARMLQKSAADRPSAAEVDAALSELALAPRDWVAPPTAPTPPAPRPRHTVARLGELAALQSAFAAAAAGAGEIVRVVGESGIGKTTLVEEFLAELAAGAKQD